MRLEYVYNCKPCTLCARCGVALATKFQFPIQATTFKHMLEHISPTSPSCGCLILSLKEEFLNEYRTFPNLLQTPRTQDAQTGHPRDWGGKTSCVSCKITFINQSNKIKMNVHTRETIFNTSPWEKTIFYAKHE